jgi:hypothetical protein
MTNKLHTTWECWLGVDNVSAFILWWAVATVPMASTSAFLFGLFFFFSEFHRSFDLAIIGLSITPLFLLHYKSRFVTDTAIFCSHRQAFGWRSTLFVGRIVRTYFDVPHIVVLVLFGIQTPVEMTLHPDTHLRFPTVMKFKSIHSMKLSCNPSNLVLDPYKYK